MEDRKINEILDRLRLCIKSQVDADIARSLGITPQALFSFKAKGKFPTDLLIKFCQKNGYSIYWLLWGKGTMIIPESETFMAQDGGGALYETSLSEAFVLIPQFRGPLVGGEATVPDLSIEMRVAFRKDWIIRKGDPRRMSLIRVRGDSMCPTLMPGDIVLVDHSRNYVDIEGGIYAINIDQSVMVKRIQPISGEIMEVRSDNPAYGSFTFNPDQMGINGKVIWFAREIE